MQDYKQLVHELWEDNSPSQYKLMLDAAEAITELTKELKACRNELCLKCGSYKNAHLGACEGCWWRWSDGWNWSVANG